MPPGRFWITFEVREDAFGGILCEEVRSALWYRGAPEPSVESHPYLPADFKGSAFIVLLLRYVVG